MIKLNLGCGAKKMKGWVNVDKYPVFEPDVLHDLEHVPWPFDDNSSSRIMLDHVLEHLAVMPDVFLAIMKELYRIAAPDTTIQINVPHPRHDNFINDPTHVRPVTPQTLQLFDLELNQTWIDTKSSNSLLAMSTGTNFKLTNLVLTPDSRYFGPDLELTVTQEELLQKAEVDLNVIREYKLTLTVKK